MMRSFSGFLGVVMAAGLVGVVPARAQLNTFIEVCGDPKANPSDVVQFCAKALKTGKLSPRATAQVLTNQGVAFYDLGRFGEAVEAYSNAIGFEPQLVAAFVNRARAYEKMKRLGDAVNDYAAALALDPQAADIYLGRGALLLGHGDPERSIQDFSTAIELQPDWISPYFNRGVAFLQLAQFAAAERDFTVVVQRNNDDAGAYLNRGRARAALGRADAGVDFDRALQIQPEWGGGWFARGKYYDGAGNREAANRDFLRAYELGYPDPWLILRVQEISG